MNLGEIYKQNPGDVYYVNNYNVITFFFVLKVHLFMPARKSTSTRYSVPCSPLTELRFTGRSSSPLCTQAQLISDEHELARDWKLSQL